MEQLLHSLDELLAVAEPTAPSGDESAYLRVRIAQLTAEYETLRASHAEAINAAVAEREDRLREQEGLMRHLRAAHLHTQLILNSAGEGIFGVDEDGVATFVNPAAARLLGWEPRELVDRFLHPVIHAPRPDGTFVAWEESAIYRTLRHGEAPINQYGDFCRRDNGTFPIEFSCMPIREDERTAGAVVTFRDITERRMLEAQLRQAQKLESIGQLAAGIAHEINTPTQYIGDNARFLQEAFADLRPLLEACAEAGRDGAPAEGLLAVIAAAAGSADVAYLLDEIPKSLRQTRDGVERVAKIVRSMKEFSHPGCDRMQAVDLHSAIESTLTVSRNEWKYVADVATEFDGSLPQVTCLPGDLNQVVLNLIINAAHAIADRVGNSGDKGLITVRTRREDEWVQLEVADTGTGIPPHARDKIFDPFFTTKDVGRGTGQGLAIARTVIVEKHGGSICFETELGRGTTFVIRLPIHHSS